MFNSDRKLILVVKWKLTLNPFWCCLCDIDCAYIKIQNAYIIVIVKCYCDQTSNLQGSSADIDSSQNLDMATFIISKTSCIEPLLKFMLQQDKIGRKACPGRWLVGLGEGCRLKQGRFKDECLK